MITARSCRHAESVPGCHPVKLQLSFSQLTERLAYRAFASLKAIVCGCVDYIRAEFQRTRDCGGIARVGLIVRVAEIGSRADRRQPKMLLFPEMVFGGAIFESFAIADRAFKCGGTED